MQRTLDDQDSLMAVQPSWTTAKGQRVGNIVWVERLFQSNRQRIYKAVAQRLVQKTSELIDVKTPEKPVRFFIIHVPGDGRCGWRSLLAASDPESFLRVPRTPVCSCYIACVSVKL